MNSASPEIEAGHKPTASANGTIQEELSFDPTAEPIWEIFDQLLSTMLAEERNKLPADTAEQHDQYIRGLPKRLA